MATAAGKVTAAKGFVEFLTHIHHLPGLMRKLEVWEIESTKVNIMITGKAGTGKTTLINALIGTNEAVEGFTLDPQTKAVEHFDRTFENSAHVFVFDSPGLQDGTVDESKYIADIKEMRDSIDLFIYCIQMSNRRFLPNNEDISAMRKLTEALGGDWWCNVIVALTFANDLVELAEEDEEPGFMKRQYDDWKATLHKYLKEDILLPEELIHQIPIVPAGHATVLKLPNYQTEHGEYYWLTDVWLQALEVTKQRAQPAMIKVNARRMMSLEEHYSIKDKNFLKGIQPLIFAKKGLALSEDICGQAGSKVAGRVAGLIVGAKTAASIFWNLAKKNKIVDDIDKFYIV